MNYSFIFVAKVLRNFAELIKSPAPVTVEKSKDLNGAYIHDTQTIRIYLPEIRTHAEFLNTLGVTAHEVFHAKYRLPYEQTARIFKELKHPLQKEVMKVFNDRLDEELGIQEYPGMAIILPFSALMNFRGSQDIGNYLRLWARTGYATGKLGEWIRRRVRQSRFTKSLSPQLLEKAYLKYVDAYRRRDIDGMIRAIKEVIPDPPETPPQETPQTGSESAENTRDGSIMMNVSLQPLSQKGQKTGPDQDAEGEESGEDPQREGLADDTPDSKKESSEQNSSEGNPVDEPMDTDDEVVEPGDQDDDSELPQEEFEAEGDVEEPVDEEQRHGDDEGGDSEDEEEEEQHPDVQSQEEPEDNEPNDPEVEQKQSTISDELLEMEDDPISQEELDQMFQQIEEEASRIVQGLAQGTTEISQAIRESAKPEKCDIREIPFVDRYSTGILMPPERVKVASPTGRISKVYRVAVNIPPTYKARIHETGRSGKLLVLLDVSGSMGGKRECPYIPNENTKIVNASLLVYWILKASTRAGASVGVLGWNKYGIYEVIRPYQTSIPSKVLIPQTDFGTSMEHAYHHVRFLSPSPDIIVTVTDGIIYEDGLYDFVRLAPHSYLVSLEDDRDYFRKYFKRVWVLTDKIPLHEFAQSIIRELNREVL